jgi:phospholipid/cholesterol/gamma-HCH transport system permease protein
MLHALRATGSRTLALLARCGRAFMVLLQMLLATPMLLQRWRLLVEQLYHVGVLTLPIILVAGLFVGMVLGLQGYNTLVDFGAESSLGLLVALSLTRELGPVLGALLFAGRAGAALTAEIGIMQATQQLAAMEMMAVDPIRRILNPRFIAGVLALPLLVMLFTAIGIYGGYFIGVNLLGVDSSSYWSAMQAGVDFRDDVLNGLVKSLVFGFVVSWIAVFLGYDARPTPEGVSRATTLTVVSSALMVLGLDFVLTSLMFD